MREKIIGKHWASTLQAAKTPGSDRYFPDPAPAMDCKTLQTNYAALLSEVEFWNNELANGSDTSAQAIQNAGEILNIQTGRLQKYQAAVSEKCTITEPTVNENGELIPATATPAVIVPARAAKNNLLLYAAGAAVLFFLFKKRN